MFQMLISLSFYKVNKVAKAIEGFSIIFFFACNMTIVKIKAFFIIIVNIEYTG